MKDLTVAKSTPYARLWLRKIARYFRATKMQPESDVCMARPQAIERNSFWGTCII